MSTVSVTYKETHTSEEAKIGAIVVGETTRAGLSNAIIANMPLTYDNLVFKQISSADLLPGRNDVWNCEVAYGAYQDKRELQSGESEFKFSPEKRSIKRTISIASKCYDSTGEITPDDLQIIGWKPNDRRAEGTTVTEYLTAFSWRVAVPFSTASEAWRRDVGDLQGTVCTSTFFGYDAGEVLFDSIDGGVRGMELYTFTLSFLRGKNKTDLTVGGITIPSIKAWETIDVDDMSFKVVTIGGRKRLIPVVQRVKVHQVQEDGDWTILGTLLGV